MKNYLLCCDWGTSSFRLRLIKLSDSQIVGEVFTDDGIASIFNSWKKNLELGGLNRDQFFRNYLTGQIDILSAQLSFDLQMVMIVISGMASSSIGMEEIPYTNLPYPVDGSQAGMRYFEARSDFPHDIILISGVRSETDVMRGEETQLVGLLTINELLSFREKEAVFIFPGTHSKHMYVSGGNLVGFQTFMTGEVFKIMSNHSILKDSVEHGKQTEFREEEIEAFKLGIRQSGRSSILNSMFRVRTNQLFNTLGKRENKYYLSGLLIGNELGYLAKKEEYELVLCSGNNLYELYKLGIEELNLNERTTTVSADVIDKATVAGQIKIYQSQTLKLNKI